MPSRYETKEEEDDFIISFGEKTRTRTKLPEKKKGLLGDF